MSRMPSGMHSTRERMNRWFQPGEGIAREVITADIQRYLGRDALVKPGSHDGVDGYWITAYRNLTSEMVQDLKQDSMRWRAEQQGHSSHRGGSPHVRDSKGARYPDRVAAPTYLDSQTHQSRQYHGPSVTPAPVDSPYEGPPSGLGQRGYASEPVRQAAAYPSQTHQGYTATPAAGYQQAGYSYPAQPAAGYQEAASYHSPASVYSHATAPTPSAYSTASGYSSSTVASYNTASTGGYAAAPQTAQYTTSTTPQSYDTAHQPRTVAGYEGYAPPDSRAVAEQYYRTAAAAQAQQQPGYGYTASVPATSSREDVYQTAGQVGTSSAAAAAYYEQYATQTQNTSRKRGHESSGHRRR